MRRSHVSLVDAMMRIVAFCVAVLLFGKGASGAFNPVPCDELIRNVFAPGPNDTIIPTFGFEQITTVGGEDAVIITVNVTAAANAYGAGLDPVTHRMRYVSVPRPPCVSEVITTCVEDYYLAAYQPSCGPSDRFNVNTGPIRFGAYTFIASGPEVPGCDGQVFTVQYNGAILSSTITAQINPFKIDLGGLLNGNTTYTPLETLEEYKAGICPFEDGIGIGNFTDTTALCYSRVMECTEPFNSVNPPYVLEASGRCQDTSGSTQRTVWRVQRTIDFRLDGSTFEHNATFASLINEPVPPEQFNPEAFLYPNSRRQYEIFTISPDVLQVGWLEAVQPRIVGLYSSSPGYNRFLPPCICNRTIFCTQGGDINADPLGIQFIDPFALPPDEPGTTIIRRTISEGEELTLTTPFVNSTGLPDLSLQYFWYEDPDVMDGPMLVSSGDSAEETFTMPNTEGSYFIYVYAFNGDDTGSAEIRLEIQANRVRTIIVAEPSNEIILNTICVLNATLSYPVNTNPNIPPLQIVNIEWKQLSGYATPLSNSASIDPSITPNKVGELIYALTLTDSNGYQDTEEILISVVDPPIPASGAPSTPETPCSIDGNVCTASESYCEFLGGVPGTTDCTSSGSSQPGIPGIGDTFCCILGNGTIPGSPVPGTIPSGPPGNNRPTSPPPPPFSPVPPRSRPLVPPSANQTEATLPGIGSAFEDFLSELQRGRPFTTTDYVFYAIVFGIQAAFLVVVSLYVCSPEIAAENELVYYAIPDDDADDE